MLRELHAQTKDGAMVANAPKAGSTNASTELIIATGAGTALQAHLENGSSDSHISGGVGGLSVATVVRVWQMLGRLDGK
jgi:hypothetical protein